MNKRKGISPVIIGIVLLLVVVFLFAGSGTISGESQVAPNTQAKFTINLTTTAPDTNCDDGFCQKQYGKWAVVGPNRQIIAESEYAEVTDGKYNVDASFTTPSLLGKYVLLSLIVQTDSTYDSATQTWSSTPYAEKVKDVKSFRVTSTPSVTPPSIGFNFVDWLTSIWDSLLCDIFQIC